MPRAISLIRVSTKGQEREGYGLQSQQNQIDAFAAREGIQILERFIEVESGAPKSRTVLHQALEACVRTDSMLLVQKMDRYARSLTTLSLLDEYAVELVTVDLGIGCSRLVRDLMLCIASEEKRAISSRTAAALKVAKVNGVKLGNPKWEDSIDSARQASNEANRAKGDRSFWAVLPFIIKAHKNGAKTVADFAVALNDDGSRTPRGKVWSPIGPRRFVKRAKAEGFIG